MSLLDFLPLGMWLGGSSLLITAVLKQGGLQLTGHSPGPQT
uniref:Uncharacterized protein n=1 Tax=Anguilla anguilla TaxID=7936 RepID=A0A0E9W0K9_ANGAN